MKKNFNQKILIDIQIEKGPTFQYNLTDSYQKFNEDLFKQGYPLSNGEISYINSNKQKIIIKSKNDFITLLRYARSVPYKIKLYYEQKILDSFINDFNFIDIQNVYSDLDINDSNLDLQIEPYDFTYNTIDTINEIVHDIDKGNLFQASKILINFFKKKCFHKIAEISGSPNYNKKINFNKIPSNKITDSLILEYKIPSIENLLNNFKRDLLKNNKNDALDKISTYMEKIDDNINNNFIFQTVLNASKIPIINNDNKTKINMNRDNKAFQIAIVQSPLIEKFGIECRNCHSDTEQNSESSKDNEEYSEDEDSSDSEKKKHKKRTKKKKGYSDDSENSDNSYKNSENDSEEDKNEEEKIILKNEDTINQTFNFQETQKFLEGLNKFFQIVDENYIKDQITKNKIIVCKNYVEKYSNFIGISYISIPIIGIVKAGKTTFLNYIHSFNKYLEVDEDIATKFICIIRHNKNNKKAKIYKVESEKTKKGSFNFKKGEEIKKNISEVISERNKKISKKDIFDPKDYFLIIEANLPIFNGTCLEKYSDIFEFMDVPGLNEASEIENSVENNYIFNQIIPIIIKNCKFFILMFDAKKYQSSDSYEIITKLKEKLENKGEKIIEDSLFFMNKMDSVAETKEEEKKVLEHFIQGMEKQFPFLNKGKLIINENIIGFSAKKLLYERNKFTNFKNYVEAIIEEELLVKNVKKEKRENFSKYLKDKFQKEILQNVELSSDEEDSEEEEEKKEKKFPNDLKDLKKNINKHFNGHFSYNEYKYYENKFNEYKGKNKEPQKNEIPQIILSSFEKKIKQIIDDFQNITQIKNFKKDIQQKLNIPDEEIEKIEENKIKQYLEKIKENPKLIKDPFETLKKLGDLIQTLLLMKNGIKVRKGIINYYESLKKYFEQERFLRIVAIGAYNSGKSSVFNTIILGKDILPVDVKECTKIGIILRHCDSEKDIGLFPVEIKKMKKIHISIMIQVKIMQLPIQKLKIKY